MTVYLDCFLVGERKTIEPSEIPGGKGGSHTGRGVSGQSRGCDTVSRADRSGDGGGGRWTSRALHAMPQTVNGANGRALMAPRKQHQGPPHSRTLSLSLAFPAPFSTLFFFLSFLSTVARALPLSFPHSRRSRATSGSVPRIVIQVHRAPTACCVPGEAVPR